jgi:hypothetical protein
MTSCVLRPASCVLLAIAMAGCGVPRQEAAERATATAWWIEDRAHGLLRDPAELALDGGGERQTAIRRWLTGPPPARRFADRCARWPQLAPLIAQGRLQLMPGGLLAPQPAEDGGLDPRHTALADAENEDRRLVDALVVEWYGLAVDGDAFLAAAAQARAALDREPSPAAR